MNCITILIILVGSFSMQAHGLSNQFSAYYQYLWGGDHISLNSQGTEATLKLDQPKGGAGFRSKLDYGSGYFHMKMKIPEQKTGGIVPNFYLTSASDSQDSAGNHFEIDFEFLGTNGRLQTNVFNNDGGGREETFDLWFDPSKDYHSYDFLWNPYQIVFFIDGIPIRVFKNNMKSGLAYPNVPMHIEASLWVGSENWVGKVDWSKAPFFANYSDFGFDACPEGPGSDCASPRYQWNNQGDLTAKQKAQMAWYRRKYMSYDYCAKPSTRKPECNLPA